MLATTCSRCPAFIWEAESLETGLCAGCRSPAGAVMITDPPPTQKTKGNQVSEAQHSPGPWVVTTGTLGGKTGQLFVRQGPGVFGSHVGHVHPRNPHDWPEGATPDAEAWANARLIASAPDLLAACQQVLARLDYLTSLWGQEGVTRGVADQLRAAVAKAEGA